MPPTQANRPLRVQTPLGTDKLLIVRLQGTEAISQLFAFELELLAENATAVVDSAFRIPNPALRAD